MAQRGGGGIDVYLWRNPFLGAVTARAKSLITINLE